MEGNFVYDISGVILTHYNKKEFEEIYDYIDTSINDLESSMNTDSAYRLQQDIAFLNTSLLNDISKYVNSKHESPIETKKKDTYEQQSKSTEINLVHKYFYLIFKLLVIFALIVLIYMKTTASSSDSAPQLSGKSSLIY